ncbi:MAG TPA: DeoR/GlpR family DNA-binding transcription regulator [Anaerolineae bacterium]|nr:DeoR/GlpR family DNA-binding transcription regulator [Anaerolineae bacterium]
MAGKSRNPAARRQFVQRQLMIEGSVSVEQLSTSLGVSVATVRRDLAWLDAEGLVRRTHGGAIVEAPRGADQEFALREQIDTDEKRAMASAVMTLIEPDATLLMNDGSTLLSVAREIVASRTRLTAITPAVNIATLLSELPGMTVFLLGGNLRYRTLGTTGSFAEQMLRSFNADLALIAAEGFTPEDGLTYSYEADATLARIMHERARKTVVLATARKLGQRDRITALQARDVDILVTGCTDNRTLARFADLGIDVVSTADPRVAVPSKDSVDHQRAGTTEAVPGLARKAPA